MSNVDKCNIKKANIKAYLAELNNFSVQSPSFQEEQPVHAMDCIAANSM